MCMPIRLFTGAAIGLTKRRPNLWNPEPTHFKIESRTKKMLLFHVDHIRDIRTVRGAPSKLSR